MINKKTIFFVLAVGFLIFFNGVLAVECPADGNWDSSTGVCIPVNTGLPDAGGSSDPIAVVIMNVMLWLLRIVGVIAIIAFVVSGIQYLTSAGNESQIETAKRNMLWSIVGVIVALIGLIILNFVFDMLSIGGSSGSGGGGNSSGNGGSVWINPDTGQPFTGSETWVNPDTGQPFDSGDAGTNVPSSSAERGENIVNSAINNASNSSVNSNENNQGLPIAN